MSNEIVPVTEMERMARAIAASGLFGIRTPDQALALMCVAQAEGLHPGIVARDYHVIQGRPTLKADTMLARFQAAGGKVKWTSYTDLMVSGVFSHPAGGEVQIEWTIERAANIKEWSQDKQREVSLAEKSNWRNYPRAMMRARVISEGVRTIYPAATVGIYTPEEVQDMAPDPKPEALEGQYHEVPVSATATTNATPAAPAMKTDSGPGGYVQQQLHYQDRINTNAATAWERPAQQPIRQPTQRPEGYRENVSGTRLISEKQGQFIKRLCMEVGVTSAELFNEFKVQELLDIPFYQADDVVAWVKKQRFDDSDQLPTT